MKNVKILLIFMITSTLLLASAQRVNSLGGNVGYWADDDNSWTAFPHTLNNSNLAQVSGLGSEMNRNAIVRWGDDTKWGFSWNQSNEDDMINLQWGNGSMGATFGLSMYSEDNGLTGDAAEKESSMGISASWGQAMGFGDLGVAFSNSSSDDGVTTTKDDHATMGFAVNLRRAQSIWLFDNMLVNFEYRTDNEYCGGECGTTSSAVTDMWLETSLFTHIDIADGTTGLISMGFGYMSSAGGYMKDATVTGIALPIYTFAVESAMTDWATCRVGVNSGYVVSYASNSGEASAKDQTWQGGMGTDLSVGLGFNYGSFNLDIDVSDDIFTNPVQHVTGYVPLTEEGTTATLTYVW